MGEIGILELFKESFTLVIMLFLSILSITFAIERWWYFRSAAARAEDILTAVRKSLEGGKTDAERVAFAFKLCVGRAPTEQEAKVVLALQAKQAEKFGDPKADPWAVAVKSADDAKKLPNNATPAQLASWVAVARVMLNLDETISKE